VYILTPFLISFSSLPISCSHMAFSAADIPSE
jgi:hypothetical protein